MRPPSNAWLPKSIHRSCQAWTSHTAPAETEYCTHTLIDKTAPNVNVENPNGKNHGSSQASNCPLCERNTMSLVGNDLELIFFAYRRLQQRCYAPLSHTQLQPQSSFSINDYECNTLHKVFFLVIFILVQLRTIYKTGLNRRSTKPIYICDLFRMPIRIQVGSFFSFGSNWFDLCSPSHL